MNPMSLISMDVSSDFDLGTVSEPNSSTRRVIFLSKRGDNKHNYFPHVGYMVETLEDVKSAGRMLTESIPVYELVILDDQLFGSSTEEALRELKGLNLNAPILALTSD